MGERRGSETGGEGGGARAVTPLPGTIDQWPVRQTRDAAGPVPTARGTAWEVTEALCGSGGGWGTA